ncbi:MAG: peptidyl-prolyl cis-trans isomerase [Cellulophaga sp.]
MFLIKRKRDWHLWFVLGIGMLVALSSCDSVFKRKVEKEPIARAGEAFLYKEDIAVLVGNKMSKQDSASFVTNYINNWASKQLLLSKAKINLSEGKIASFEQLVSAYRTDLYTRAYKEALVQQLQDATLSSEELEAYYEKEKENFKLKEKLVKLRFIALPKQFLNKRGVIEKLKRFNKEDVNYLDSIGVQFKKMNFNDSIWVNLHRVLQEIPALTNENEVRYLKKSQFFEIQDSIGVYLGKVTDVLEVNDVAPLSFVRSRIEQIILNRRRLNYIRKLETEIIDEAIKEKEFEIYVKDK